LVGRTLLNSRPTFCETRNVAGPPAPGNDEESYDSPGGQFPARRSKFPARLNKFPVRRNKIPCSDF
jgi:hypothetical protein